jgi:hypothetical protein
LIGTETQELQTHLLVLLVDQVSNDLVVLQGGQPELGNTLDVGLVARLINLFNTSLLIVLVRVRDIADGLTGSDLLLSGLSLSGDDLLSSSVERSVSGGELERTT